MKTRIMLVGFVCAGVVSIGVARAQFVGGGSIGASGAMSGAAILAALLGVDGAASGLDADLLDGISSAAFTQSGTAVALPDANTTCASALALSWTGDTDTGLQRSGADAALFCLGGVAELTLTGASLTYAGNGAFTGTTTSTGFAATSSGFVVGGGGASVDFGCAANDTCSLVGGVGTSSIQINASASASGNGEIALTPGVTGRVGLNRTQVTALAASLCDADAEVGDMYVVSANAAADINVCICTKVANAFAFAPTTALGDCTP